jgi:hypothetical protein
MALLNRELFRRLSHRLDAEHAQAMEATPAWWREFVTVNEVRAADDHPKEVVRALIPHGSEAYGPLNAALNRRWVVPFDDRDPEEVIASMVQDAGHSLVETMTHTINEAFLGAEERFTIGPEEDHISTNWFVRRFGVAPTAAVLFAGRDVRQLGLPPGLRVVHARPPNHACRSLLVLLTGTPVTITRCDTMRLKLSLHAEVIANELVVNASYDTGPCWTVRRTGPVMRFDWV